ncbi:hypothetical protein HK105_204395 [Polyrhizophydium stewartii]|uniref:Transmembrane protein n=1 Tax=Polyrhizophydium stewartii TaxID=2732419 RepID=A0ABR4N8W2_9FUNG
MCDQDLLVQRDKIAYALGVFMCLSVQNCFDNLAMLARRPTLARALQLTASVCHTIDNGVFILQNSLRWLPSCDGLSAVGDMSFYVFQVLSTGILIFRGTALLPASVVTAARVVLGATGFVAFALNVVSGVLKNVFVTQDGWCVTIYSRTWNDKSKLVYVGLFASILCCFVVPVVQTFSNVFSGEASGNRVRLRQFIAGFAAKIALAVVVYLATTVLSLVGFWGDYFFVHVLASTWSSMIVDNGAADRVVAMSELRWAGAKRSGKRASAVAGSQPTPAQSLAMSPAPTQAAAAPAAPPRAPSDVQRASADSRGE